MKSHWIFFGFLFLVGCTKERNSFVINEKMYSESKPTLVSRLTISPDLEFEFEEVHLKEQKVTGVLPVRLKASFELAVKNYPKGYDVWIDNSRQQLPEFVTDVLQLVRSNRPAGPSHVEPSNIK